MVMLGHALTPIRRWEWIALTAILLLAAVLRLAAPGITEFKRDEANLSQLALDLAQRDDLPLLGISSSVNLPNSPISVCLFALPYALDSRPIAATLFVGLLNVLAVALTWGLVRRYYGPLDGQVAADYQAFIHALDANGARIGQVHRPAWPGAYWRAGDTLVLWFDFTLPPETAALYTGMYTTDGVKFDNVPLVDAQGDHLDQGATIPLADLDQ